jgi:hypothetical protein
VEEKHCFLTSFWAIKWEIELRASTQPTETKIGFHSMLVQFGLISNSIL